MGGGKVPGRALSHSIQDLAVIRLCNLVITSTDQCAQSGRDISFFDFREEQRGPSGCMLSEKRSMPNNVAPWISGTTSVRKEARLTTGAC